MTQARRDAHLPDYALAERREMLCGIGYGPEAMERIQVGVVSTWGEVNPAAVHLDKVAEAVKAGVWAAGGTPREVVMSSICTSMAGDDRYLLPVRDLIAGYIETVACVNLLDALVLVPVCDDVIPGHLMAAARLDLPTVVVTGGYMQLNRWREALVDPLQVAAGHLVRHKDGATSAAEFAEIVDRGCQGGGACPVMGTANTMAALAEALGMSLPGNASTPGSDSRLLRLAFESGRQAVELHRGGLTAGRILTRDAFENAIRVLMAVGGSSNGVLHLQAVAAERGIELDPETFNRLNRDTNLICDIAPSGSGTHFMAELDEAGGIQAVMKELEPLLHADVPTVSGESLRANLGRAEVRDRRIIRPLDDPIAQGGGLLFLRGTLAPAGGLVKTSAVPPAMHRHRGPARIFATEEAACAALEAAELAAGDVVVVRFAGPKGDPGMRLLQRFLWQLAARGLHDRIAFVTDGRISGTNKGCAVTHIGPEAADGGPLALVEEGDAIEIDIPGGRLDVDVPSDELRRRRQRWQAPAAKVGGGYLSVYARLARSAAGGAALDYGAATQAQDEADAARD
jgi:dihydroxy-acid dehydratase